MSTGGKRYDGLCYFFQDVGAAKGAAHYLTGKNLSAKIHVAYFDVKTGALTWLR